MISFSYILVDISNLCFHFVLMHTYSIEKHTKVVLTYLMTLNTTFLKRLKFTIRKPFRIVLNDKKRVIFT